MTDQSTPSTNGRNGGRDARGRFLRGNVGGPGNPYCRDVARKREAFRSAASDADLRAICRKLVAMAKKGNLLAVREVLDRIIGKCPTAADDGDGDSQKLLPIFEVIVSNRDEALQFKDISDHLLRQVRHASLRDASVGLPAPADD